MRRIGNVFFSVLSSRALPPLVMVFFLIMYAGIAVFSDEALAMLMAQIRRNPFLTILLALIPLNAVIRLVRETARFLRRRRLIKTGRCEGLVPGMFDEMIDLSFSPSLARLQEQLAATGYRVQATETSLAAWRGVTVFPARILFLAGMIFLFSGILFSLTTRTTRREMLIEGEPLSWATGERDRIENVSLQEHAGLFFNRALTVKLATHDGIRKTFGLYPPSRYQGAFLYPRYLGIAPLVRFSAPDLPGGFETHYILMIYPPGKEDSADIPGTAYRVFFSLAPAESGDDPFITGRMALLFRVLKEKEPVATGRVLLGGESSKGGYRLGFPDFRRVVATDFVRDHGVIPIWMALVFFAAALLWWLPARFISPRREIFFVQGFNGIHAVSRAEGMRIRHGGVFHAALDSLENNRATHD